MGITFELFDGEDPETDDEAVKDSDVVRVVWDELLNAGEKCDMVSSVEEIGSEGVEGEIVMSRESAPLLECEVLEGVVCKSEDKDSDRTEGNVEEDMRGSSHTGTVTGFNEGAWDAETLAGSSEVTKPASFCIP